MVDKGFTDNGKILGQTNILGAVAFEYRNDPLFGRSGSQFLNIDVDCIVTPPINKLLDRVSVKRIADDRPIRAFSDYQVTIQNSDLPDGVTLERLEG